ncbi:mitochondrial iron ion transporter [Pholiota conissans]|uniref:Mitochondrial iron ion transporter n=1 Tax=Pholiota conissans TaxID=109636 RepID=A0A9P5Z5N6_9AGAR|nr:mitochondrial iron ion transporter [Pholiota conissans]
MPQTRSHSTKKESSQSKEPAAQNGHEHSTGHEHHDHDSEHEHTHSHSIFGHSHSHGEEHTHDAEQIIAALKGSGDRGSYITLVGLFSNIALTTAKGVAGWYLHSASLLADAGHSMSDLLGDFVTLFCWRLSRKPPSERYPYGFAKFETLGTTTISLLLIGGALGIGFHSYHLLIVALSETATHLPPGPLFDILTYISSSAPLPAIGHGHVHAVDVNAAWFAAGGVLCKEWLYRITKVVADQEKSPVLLANAIHHRSDAYSSLVAFFAILGTWFFPAFPLDPIGGLVVSVVILKQGFDLLAGAWGDLTDAGASPRTRQSLKKILEPLVSTTLVNDHDGSHLPPLVSIQNLRARHAGSLLFVDLTAEVSGSITVLESSALEKEIERTLKAARKEVTEVRVTFRPAEKLKQS